MHRLNSDRKAVSRTQSDSSWVSNFMRPAVVLMVGMILIVGLLLQFIFPETGTAWSQEGGPIEVLSVVVLGVGFILTLIQAIRHPSAGWIAGTMLFGWATLRELDFQKMFTYRSVESLGFYTRPIAPLSEKLLAIAILMPFALAGLYLLRLLVQVYRTGEWKFARWSPWAVAAAALLAVAMLSEKILGWSVIEETCELGMALALVCLAWKAIQSSLKNKSNHSFQSELSGVKRFSKDRNKDLSLTN